VNQVIGPNANDTLVPLGNYHGLPAFGNVSTPLLALQRRLGAANVAYAHGCVVTGDGAWEFDDAIAAADGADVALFFIGSSAKGSFEGENALDTVEKEGLDRRAIDLPGLQGDLIKAVSKHTKTPIVVVLVSGGPIAIEDVMRNDRVRAIVVGWYGGQMAGEALADVLLGDVSPAGRLPVTIYAKNYTDQVQLCVCS
jgi:beta-glucosidase